MEKDPKELARDAKAASLKLRVLPTVRRRELLERIADAVEKRQKEILDINARDVQNAKGLALKSRPWSGQCLRQNC